MIKRLLLIKLKLKFIYNKSIVDIPGWVSCLEILCMSVRTLKNGNAQESA